MLKLNVNGVDREVDAAPETPLLWVLRDSLRMTGTKFGCGAALCGACTVHLDGAALRSCVMPAGAVVGRKVRTIEDLNANGLSALQQAWIRHQVPQCGYCQSGMLMAASALLATNPDPSDADIDAGITNICRCGTYPRIRAAIKDAAKMGGVKGNAPQAHAAAAPHTAVPIAAAPIAAAPIAAVPIASTPAAGSAK
jgi:isoquinoline 1-oxidoreductase alpha subunit